MLGMLSARATPTEAPDVPQELVRLMFAIGAAYESASRELGLTPQQARLLCAAGRLPTAGLGDLATVMRCDRSNVSRLVERAAQRGLVARKGTEADGRVRVVALSEDGQRLVDDFTERLESRLEAVVRDWSDADRRTAAQILGTLTESLNRGPEPAEASPVQRPAGAHLLPPG
jgi:DNA-binding MarR family transcriptional regulator